MITKQSYVRGNDLQRQLSCILKAQFDDFRKAQERKHIPQIDI